MCRILVRIIIPPFRVRTGKQRASWQVFGLTVVLIFARERRRYWRVQRNGLLSNESAELEVVHPDSTAVEPLLTKLIPNGNILSPDSGVAINSVPMETCWLKHVPAQIRLSGPR
jgi:hypothetical protein